MQSIQPVYHPVRNPCSSLFYWKGSGGIHCLITVHGGSGSITTLWCSICKHSLPPFGKSFKNLTGLLLQLLPCSLHVTEHLLYYTEYATQFHTLICELNWNNQVLASRTKHELADCDLPASLDDLISLANRIDIRFCEIQAVRMLPTQGKVFSLTRSPYLSFWLKGSATEFKLLWILDLPDTFIRLCSPDTGFP